MFKGLGNLGNLTGMLKQAMEVKGKMDEFKAQLANETVEVSAGGGMVTVVMRGTFEVESIKIDPEIVDKNDVEMLETMVRAAVNEATHKIQDMVKSKMMEMTGGMELPGLG